VRCSTQPYIICNVKTSHNICKLTRQYMCIPVHILHLQNRQIGPLIINIIVYLFYNSSILIFLFNSFTCRELLRKSWKRNYLRKWAYVKICLHNGISELGTEDRGLESTPRRDVLVIVYMCTYKALTLFGFLSCHCCCFHWRKITATLVAPQKIKAVRR
jgi:hypothetical protein